MRFRPGEQFLGRFGHVLDALGRIFDQRTRRIIVDDDAEALALGPMQVERRRLVILLEAGELVIVGRQELDPETLLEPGRQPSLPVSTMSMSTRPASCCALILPAVRARGLDVSDARHEFGLGLPVLLESLLHQRERAAHVHHVEGDRRLGKSQALSANSGDGERRDAGPAGDEDAAIDMALVTTYVCSLLVCHFVRR